MGHLICSTHQRRALVIGGKVIHRSGHEIDGKYCAPQVVIDGKKVSTSGWTRETRIASENNIAARNLLQQIFGWTPTGKGF